MINLSEVTGKIQMISFLQPDEQALRFLFTTRKSILEEFLKI